MFELPLWLPWLTPEYPPANFAETEHNPLDYLLAFCQNPFFEAAVGNHWLVSPNVVAFRESSQ